MSKSDIDRTVSHLRSSADLGQPPDSLQDFDLWLFHAADKDSGARSRSDVVNRRRPAFLGKGDFAEFSQTFQNSANFDFRAVCTHPHRRAYFACRMAPAHERHISDPSETPASFAACLWLLIGSLNIELTFFRPRPVAFPASRLLAAAFGLITSASVTASLHLLASRPAAPIGDMLVAPVRA